MCEGIEGTVVPEGNPICVMSKPSHGTIDSPCDEDPRPSEALVMQEVEVDLGRRSRPWWDFMNDPRHPSRRKARPRRTDVMSCGPGGCIGLYWYWIGCPSPSDVRPKTPAFYCYD